MFMELNAENRRKRLKYQAWHRGIKEVDLVLGPFADEHLPLMDGRALDEFESLLGAPDQEIYDWLCEKSTPPDRYRTKTYEQVFDFSRRAGRL